MATKTNIMSEITIQIKELSEKQRLGGRGLFAAQIETKDNAIRVCSKEDDDKRPDDESTTIYRQTQMMGLAHKIEFCLMAIADGRVL